MNHEKYGREPEYSDLAKAVGENICVLKLEPTLLRTMKSMAEDPILRIHCRVFSDESDPSIEKAVALLDKVLSSYMITVEWEDILKSYIMA